MKKSATILCICLSILGVIVALRTTTARTDASPPAQPVHEAPPSAPSHPASPPFSARRDVPPLAPGAIPDAANIQALQQQLTDRQAEYDRIRQDGQRQRDAWQKRWAAETAAFKATTAALDQSIAAEKQKQQEAEARLHEILTAAKAEAEREQRERAEQAATPPPAPQQASDF